MTTSMILLNFPIPISFLKWWKNWGWMRRGKQRPELVCPFSSSVRSGLTDCRLPSFHPWVIKTTQGLKRSWLIWTTLSLSLSLWFSFWPRIPFKNDLQVVKKLIKVKRNLTWDRPKAFNDDLSKNKCFSSYSFTRKTLKWDSKWTSWLSTLTRFEERQRFLSMAVTSIRVIGPLC